MKCKTHCGISVGFVLASVAVMLSCSSKKGYYQKLNEDQKKMYKKVVQERRNIWIIATVSAILAALAFHFLFNKNKEGGSLLACENTAIYFVVQYFVYSLYPKKNWILNSLKTPEEVQGWVNKYQDMKTRWHVGIILGLVGYFFYSYFMVKNNM